MVKKIEKQTIKKIALIVGLVLAGILLAAWLDSRYEANRQAYAESHNCEWEATGTYYGDDRDYVCK